MRIHREGYHIILTTFTIVTLAAISGFLWLSPNAAIWLSAFLLIFFTFVVRFFRDPRRSIVPEPNLVYAPADGTVVVVEEVNETEYFGATKIQVSVFMSVWNVHVNWYPVGGAVSYFKYHPGRFLVAWHPKSSEENERTTVVVKTENCEIMFRQIAGFIARRIVAYAQPSGSATPQKQCGFIKFGSRVDVFLPVDSEICVKIGEKVIGSQTVIAKLP